MEYSKIIGGVLSIIIIGIIIATGPAQAVLPKLDIADNKVSRGTLVNIMGSAEVVSPEIVDIDYIILKLSGPEEIECKFNANGTLISGCEGINVKIIILSEFGYGYGLKYKPEEGYGYGYGYKPGSLKYNITIETDNYMEGVYETSLGVVSGEKVFTKNGDKITISGIDLGKCSVRASNGFGTIQNIDFSKNKINFYVPLLRATDGDGYLNAQQGRSIVNYRFKVQNIISNNSSYIKMKVSGKYRMGTSGKFVDEKAILTFDRINNKISVVGNNIKINDMKISFRRGC